MRSLLPLLVVSFAVLLGGCARDSDGMGCEGAEDCDPGQRCVAVAVCSTAPCPGICGVPCETSETCRGGKACNNFPGGSICYAAGVPE